MHLKFHLLANSNKNWLHFTFKKSCDGFLHCKQEFKRTKSSQFCFCFFGGDSECFTLAWQAVFPGGSSKMPPHTGSRKVHLARLLPGLSWPTLQPSQHNQQAEQARPFSTSPPATHYISSPIRWSGGSTEPLHGLKIISLSTGPFRLDWFHKPIWGWMESHPNTWAQQATVDFWDIWKSVACLWPK